MDSTIYMRQWRKDNPQKVKDYAKHGKNYGKLSRIYHEKAIIKLGGKCVVCGETDVRILQINHINGGGNQERKKRNPVSFYLDIIAGRRKTDDLDVRCVKHNILARYGE